MDARKTNFLCNLKKPLILALLLFGQNNTVGQKRATWQNRDSFTVAEKVAIAQKNLDDAHRENVIIARSAAKNYIKRNIDDKKMERFMIDCILTEGDDYYTDIRLLLDPDIKRFIITINQDYKWFDWLMKYLSGRCSDKEFYNSGFFSDINSSTNGFLVNTVDIERWAGFVERNKVQVDTTSFNNVRQR